MKKTLFLSVLAFALALFATAVPRSAAQSDTQTAPALTFDENGHFTVLVLADAQDTFLTVPYLIDGIEAVLDEGQPDLVVLLGDQVEAQSPLMRIGDPAERVQTVIDRVLTPIVSRNIPFAVVFGNHDAESGVSNAAQLAMYRRYPGCINPEAYGNGAFWTPVGAREDGEARLSLYLFDSGAYAPDGGYGCVSREQVDWYIETSRLLREENAGAVVPAVAFQHIVVGEIYDALDEVPAGTQGAYKGIGSGAERFFSPSAQSILAGQLREAPCPSAFNYGQFDALLSQNEVFALFSGHDHINDYIISHRGIDLVACPGATYTNYNARQARGVRMLRFSEDNVRNYETMLLPFARYERVSLLGMLPYYLLTTTRVPNFIKVPAAALLLVIAPLVFAVIRRKRKRRKADAPGEQAVLAPEFDN